MIRYLLERLIRAMLMMPGISLVAFVSARQPYHPISIIMMDSFATSPTLRIR